MCHRKRRGEQLADNTDIRKTWLKDTVPSTATISGAPTGTNNTTALNVTGEAATDITKYQHKVVAGTTCPTGGYGDNRAVASKITDNVSSYQDGKLTLCVLGIDAAGNVQTETGATKATWTKGTSGGGTNPPTDPTDPTDPTPPTDPAKVINIGTIAGDDTIDSTEAASGVTVSGTTSSNLNGKKITVKIVQGGKTKVAKNTIISSGNWSVSFTSGDLGKVANGSAKVVAIVMTGGGKYQADVKNITVNK